MIKIHNEGTIYSLKFLNLSGCCSTRMTFKIADLILVGQLCINVYLCDSVASYHANFVWTEERESP